MAPKQPPHGGTLVNLMGDVPVSVAPKVRHFLHLTERQSCDVELLCNGGFSPLTGFMTECEYNSVVDEMRLPSKLIFSLPVVLDTSDPSIAVGDIIILRYRQTDMATMVVSSKWLPDKAKECSKCYGTTSIEHPGVRMVASERGTYYIGGKLTGITMPTRDFPCLSPKEVRATLPDDADVVAFQCRNPIHRAHYELFTRALDAPNVQANLTLPALPILPMPMFTRRQLFSPFFSCLATFAHLCTSLYLLVYTPIPPSPHPSPPLHFSRQYVSLPSMSRPRVLWCLCIPHVARHNRATSPALFGFERMRYCRMRSRQVSYI